MSSHVSLIQSPMYVRISLSPKFIIKVLIYSGVFVVVDKSNLDLCHFTTPYLAEILFMEQLPYGWGYKIINAVLVSAAIFVLLFHFLIIFLIIIHNREMRIAQARRPQTNLLKTVILNCLLAFWSAIPFCLVNISAQLMADYIFGIRKKYKSWLALGYHDMNCEKDDFHAQHLYFIHLLASLCNGWCWIVRQIFELVVALSTDAKLRTTMCLQLWPCRKWKQLHRRTLEQPKQLPLTTLVRLNFVNKAQVNLLPDTDTKATEGQNLKTTL